MFDDGGDDRAADLGRAFVDDSEVALLALLLLGGRGDAAVDVLRHDDAHVGHVADGDRQAGQRHDVAVDAEAGTSG